jgi:hypothetical protein
MSLLSNRFLGFLGGNNDVLRCHRFRRSIKQPEEVLLTDNRFSIGDPVAAGTVELLFKSIDLPSSALELRGQRLNQSVCGG